jgi:predicted AlkP superfamily pyrophosphatase or phosphodiesterase
MKRRLYFARAALISGEGMKRSPGVLFPVIFLLIVLCATASWARSLLVISIDGLRPDYVTHADEHGLKVPNMRRFMREGAHAAGVTGVNPTVTYPSHTTLMTGVWPAEHGIFANLMFDPLRKNQSEWYWYAEDIKVPTLWTVASQAGLSTASVNWPVTVGAPGIQYLIPEYWRVRGDPNDRKLVEALAKPNLFLNELEASLGPFDSAAEDLDFDRVLTKFAVEIIRSKKPAFMTIHLPSLDEAEHNTGPFSAESNRTMEEVDRLIGQLADAELHADPDALVAVVSDHGFVPTDHRVNLMVPFVKEGLVTLKGDGKSIASPIATWKASVWTAGGLSAIMLSVPNDAAVKAQVKDLLLKLQADPANGIGRVLDQAQIAKTGGFPDAAFLVDWKPGYYGGAALTGTMVESVPATGTHGYLPDNPDLRASFFIMGRGVAAGRDLGVIDMRQIAPTFAGILGVKLPAAKAEKLAVLGN